MLRILTIAVTMNLLHFSQGVAQGTLRHGVRDGEFKTPRAILRAKEIRGILSENIQIPEEFRRDQVDLVEFLKYFLDDASLKRRPIDLTLDRAAFVALAPRAPEIWETKIEFPQHAAHLPIREALQIAIESIRGHTAALLVKNGRVEIVPEQYASIKYLLDQRVVMQSKQTPLKNAVDELAAIAGVTIILDPRCKSDGKHTVSADANNDISVRALLSSWADIHDLKLVVDEHRVMLMPRADYLRKQRDDSEEAALQAKILKDLGSDPETMRTSERMSRAKLRPSYKVDR